MSPPTRHKLLDRQIRRLLGGTASGELGPFLAAVEAAYRQADDDRAMLERSLELTSQELMEQNTQLRKAKEHAEEMLRLKSSFLDNMSHEIRTPLTGILGYAELLADEVPDADRTLVDAILRGGRRLMDTLNSVLDLAQLESGSFALAPDRLDVRAEAAEVVALLAPLARPKGIGLALAPGPEAVWAQADRAALFRVLNNVVGNAVKFTEAGRVTVSAEADGGAVRIRVCDTGPGLDPAFVPHLFDAFRQASSGHDRRHEGNGLGLTITQRLVEMMGGAIAVESAPGEGTTFEVRLPAAEAPVGALALSPPRGEAGGNRLAPRRLSGCRAA